MPTEVIETLAQLVRINSVNSFYAGGPGEAELAAYVERFFRERNIETWTQTVLPGRQNVIARVPGKSNSRRILLEAHLDTVSIEGMSIDPFEPTLSEGRLYGRGACDTKAGLAAMMHALVDLDRLGRSQACEVWLVAVVDEEFSSKGILHFCQDCQAEAALVAEPTDMRAVSVSKGVLRWRMVAHGRAAHSSKTHLGINAISHMARVVLALERDHQNLAGQSHPLVGPATCNVGLIEGGVQVNFVPDRCAIDIDRRLLPGERVAEVLAHYQSLLDDLAAHDATFDVRMEPPMLVDEGLNTPDGAAVAQVASEVLSELGRDPTLAGVPFGSDASKLSQAGVPSLIIGPGSIDQAHGAIEYVPIDQVELAQEFYRRFAVRFTY